MTKERELSESRMNRKTFRMIKRRCTRVARPGDTHPRQMVRDA
jgi:hypothetical protein